MFQLSTRDRSKESRRLIQPPARFAVYDEKKCRGCQNFRIWIAISLSLWKVAPSITE